ncbi:hypothetical protein CCP4SC76_5250007 [Gammaproteobacteria bacterium]
MSINVLTTSGSSTCPSCGSPEVRQKRTLKSALPWFALFVLFLVLAAVTPYPSPPGLVFGMGAWVFLLIAIGMAIYSAFSKYRCRECKHKWR